MVVLGGRCPAGGGTNVLHSCQKPVATRTRLMVAESGRRSRNGTPLVARAEQCEAEPGRAGVAGQKLLLLVDSEAFLERFTLLTPT